MGEGRWGKGKGEGEGEMVRRRKKRKGSCMREGKEDKETVLSVEMRREGGREHAQEGGKGEVCGVEGRRESDG